jgi:hypothetical protein
MHRLHFKYGYQAAILENQLRAITPELMAGSTPNFNHRYIYLLGIYKVSSQEVSTMALAISLYQKCLKLHMHVNFSVLVCCDAKCPILLRWTPLMHLPFFVNPTLPFSNSGRNTEEVLSTL